MRNIHLHIRSEYGMENVKLFQGWEILNVRWLTSKTTEDICLDVKAKMSCQSVSG